MPNDDAPSERQIRPDQPPPPPPEDRPVPREEPEPGSRQIRPEPPPPPPEDRPVPRGE